MNEVYMLKITLKAKLINATEFVTDKARERGENFKFNVLKRNINVSNYLHNYLAIECRQQSQPT